MLELVSSLSECVIVQIGSVEYRCQRGCMLVCGVFIIVEKNCQ